MLLSTQLQYGDDPIRNAEAVVALEQAKSADLAWFALAALPDPVVPHERYVLDGLRAGTLAPIVAFGF